MVKEQIDKSDPHHAEIMRSPMDKVINHEAMDLCQDDLVKSLMYASLQFKICRMASVILNSYFFLQVFAFMYLYKLDKDKFETTMRTAAKSVEASEKNSSPADIE